MQAHVITPLTFSNIKEKAISTSPYGLIKKASTDSALYETSITSIPVFLQTKMCHFKYKIHSDG